MMAGVIRFGELAADFHREEGMFLKVSDVLI